MTEHAVLKMSQNALYTAQQVYKGLPVTSRVVFILGTFWRYRKADASFTKADTLGDYIKAWVAEIGKVTEEERAEVLKEHQAALVRKESLEDIEKYTNKLYQEAVAVREHVQRFAECKLGT